MGIFLPMRQPAGMYCSRALLLSPDAAWPSRLHSPGPDLILHHQLFPGSLDYLHASRSEKMCFTLWPCRKHARSVIQLTYAPVRWNVTVWAQQQQALKLTDLILSTCDLSPMNTQLLNNPSLKASVTLSISGISVHVENFLLSCDAYYG